MTVPVRFEWMIRRDLAVLLLLYGCGLRISEAIELTRADAPTKVGRLRVLGKTGTRKVEVPAVVAEAVRRYLDVCPHQLSPSGPLFVSAKGTPFKSGQLSQRVTKLALLIGLRGIATAHDLRRKSATTTPAGLVRVYKTARTKLLPPGTP
jgi:integrase/recombinase XerC